jgi:hypothetical protein
VQPGSIIDDNSVLAALQKSKSALMGVKKDPFAFLKPRVGKTTANKSGAPEAQDMYVCSRNCPNPRPEFRSGPLRVLHDIED